MSVAFGKPDEPSRFDELRDYLQRIERERAEREFCANPPAWTRPPFTTRTHAINPTRLDQERTMTSPTQRRHDELVALLRDIAGNTFEIHALLDERLPEPTTRGDWLDEPIPVPRPEPVDVTDDLEHENEGLSWRWAECADERDAAVARAERAEADVDRLARQRDEWEAKYRQVDDLLSRARDGGLT